MKAVYLPMVPILLCAAGCPLDDPNDFDDQVRDTETDTESGTGTQTTGTDEPEACPGVSDPECTTNAGCAPDQLCVDCMCVATPSECENSAQLECLEDSDCGALEQCLSCQCYSLCNTKPPSDQCGGDEDCEQGETCVYQEGEFGRISGCWCESPSQCPADAECETDDQCMSGSTCVDCACVDDCECEANDECEGLQESCDGCSCQTCGSGQANPIDPLGDPSEDVVVTGVAIEATLSGEPGPCPDFLCVVTVANNRMTPTFFNGGAATGEEPIISVPDDGIIPPMSTMDIGIVSNTCDTPMMTTYPVFFQDSVDLVELGRVDLDVTTLLPR